MYVYIYISWNICKYICVVLNIYLHIRRKRDFCQCLYVTFDKHYLMLSPISVRMICRTPVQHVI